MSWTLERVLALAPDAGSASSGKGLSNLSHWVSSGRSGLDGQGEGALWGECKGSGKTPYQTRIDLRGPEPGFKCACPSRKFPCKHGLGLFLMYAAAPGQLPEAAPPAWVQEWLDTRGAKAEARAEKVAKADTPEEQARKAKAAAKKQADKEERLEAGLDEFGLWLRDLVRGGLAGAPGWGSLHWDTPARRLVDAGAGGLARRVRELAGIPPSGEGWQGRLLEKLGTLHLLLEGHRNREGLSAGERADLMQALGQTVSSEEVLAGAGVRDRWLTLGSRTLDLEQLQERRTYLRGLSSRQDTLVLEFSFGNRGFEAGLPLGRTFEGELCFFAGARPHRALVRPGGRDGAGSPEGQGTDVNGLLERYSEALSQNLWLERIPALLSAVTISSEAVWDGSGAALPLPRRFPPLWTLLALSGGHPVTLFGEWNGRALYPLSVWVEGVFHALG